MSESKQTTRLAAIDAVRGIAAFAVVLVHVPNALRSASGLPGWLARVFENGFYGVDAFFVLSGFVISMSVANGNWVPSYLPRFLLRRSIRLDPSYWFAIALEVALGWVGVKLFADSYPFPSTSGVLAHLVYLQGLLGFEQISEVFWTLCFEVQFYALLVGMLVFSHAAIVRRVIPPFTLLAIVFVLTMVWSLCVRAEVVSTLLPGLVDVRLYQFGIGIVTYLWARKFISVEKALLILTPIFVARLASHAWIESSVLALTAIVCFLSFSGTKVNQLAAGPILQFFGRISYSLYLFHGSILTRVSAVVLLVLPKFAVSVPGWIGLLGAIAASVVFSAVMRELLEAPTMRLSKKIRLP